MSDAIVTAMLASLRLAVLRKQITAATACGLIVMCTEGSAAQAIATLPTTTRDPVLGPFLRLMRDELRRALDEQEGEARALLTRHEREPGWLKAASPAKSGPRVTPHKFRIVK